MYKLKKKEEKKSMSTTAVVKFDGIGFVTWK
jgi:hypothetical protein